MLAVHMALSCSNRPFRLHCCVFNTSTVSRKRLLLSIGCLCAVQQGGTSCRLDGASLQHLLHMADQHQVSTSHQLALLHPLHPNMPAHIVSGFSPHHATLTVTVRTCGGAISVTDHLLYAKLQQMHAAGYAGCKLLVSSSCAHPVAEQSLSSPRPTSKHVHKLLCTTPDAASPDSAEKHAEHRSSVDVNACHAFEMIASNTFASKEAVWLLGVGPAPVAMPRMQPPSLMPSPPPPWLVEQGPRSQLPAGQLNHAGIPLGNHPFPHTFTSSQRESAGLLRLSQVLPRNSMMHLFWWVRFLCT